MGQLPKSLKAHLLIPSAVQASQDSDWVGHSYSSDSQSQFPSKVSAHLSIKHSIKF